ncbi:hypothetical protein ACWD25_61735 [Streptomyces sp. NPDC002920]
MSDAGGTGGAGSTDEVPAVFRCHVVAEDAEALRKFIEETRPDTGCRPAARGTAAGLGLTMLRRAFEAKFWPHVTTIQAVLPHLTPDGSITLLSAITARTGMPGTAGIAALNGAVEALVKPLAAELSRSAKTLWRRGWRRWTVASRSRRPSAAALRRSRRWQATLSAALMRTSSSISQPPSAASRGDQRPVAQQRIPPARPSDQPPKDFQARPLSRWTWR